MRFSKFVSPLITLALAFVVLIGVTEKKSFAGEVLCEVEDAFAHISSKITQFTSPDGKEKFYLTIKDGDQIVDESEIKVVKSKEEIIGAIQSIDELLKNMNTEKYPSCSVVYERSDKEEDKGNIERLCQRYLHKYILI